MRQNTLSNYLLFTIQLDLLFNIHLDLIYYTGYISIL